MLPMYNILCDQCFDKNTSVWESEKTQKYKSHSQANVCRRGQVSQCVCRFSAREYWGLQPPSGHKWFKLESNSYFHHRFITHYKLSKKKNSPEWRLQTTSLPPTSVSDPKRHLVPEGTNKTKRDDYQSSCWFTSFRTNPLINCSSDRV